MPPFVVEPFNEALRLDRADLFRWEIGDSYEKPAQQLNCVIIISNLRAGVSDASNEISFIGLPRHITIDL